MTVDLFLFSTHVETIQASVPAGVAGVIVDCEQGGKAQRQQQRDTQISTATMDDLRAVRACTTARVICRINPYGPSTRDEVAEACDAGADEVLLPMVRTLGEVERTLELARGRGRLGIMIETQEAVALQPELATLPLARAYVGLNDLAIDLAAPCGTTAAG